MPPRNEDRFLFVVRSMCGAWEVTFGAHGACFRFETRAGAIAMAERAAKMHWQTALEPSGVQVIEEDMHEVVAVFGAWDAR